MTALRIHPRLRPHADRHLLPLVTLCAALFIWLTASPNGAAQGPLDQALATLRLRDAARDEILMLDGKAPDAAALAATAVHGPALFLVRNAGGTRHVLVDPWSKAAGPHPVGRANVLDPDVAVF